MATIYYKNLTCKCEEYTNNMWRNVVENDNSPTVDPAGHEQTIPCLESADICLQFITNKTRTEPQLLTFRIQQANYKTHPITGQRLIVPNIVHFVRFGENFTFGFVDYISMISVQRFIKPGLIFIWGDFLPKENSIWWMRTLRDVANLYYVYVESFTSIYGKPVLEIIHVSDVVRIKVLQG